MMTREELEIYARKKYDINTITGYQKYCGFMDAVIIILGKK
jgi:hypothetical protein